MDLTISEYAKRFNVSQQSVYAKIKRGTLTTIVKDNTKYIQCDASMFKDAKSSSVEDIKSVKVEQSIEQYKFKALRKDYKQLLKVVEKKDKQIEKLLNKVENLQNQLISAERDKTKFITDNQNSSNKHFENIMTMFNKAMTTYQGKQLPELVETEIVEDKPKKKKKKK